MLLQPRVKNFISLGLSPDPELSIRLVCAHSSNYFYIFLTTCQHFLHKLKNKNVTQKMEIVSDAFFACSASQSTVECVYIFRL